MKQKLPPDSIEPRGSFFSKNLRFKLHLAVHADNLAQNGYVLLIERLHRIILRLEADAIFFLEEALYSSAFAIYQGYNNIVVLGSVLL